MNNEYVIYALFFLLGFLLRDKLQSVLDKRKRGKEAKKS